MIDTCDLCGEPKDVVPSSISGINVVCFGCERIIEENEDFINGRDEDDDIERGDSNE